MPSHNVCKEHNCPMDYIWNSFTGQVPECVVWACRNGAKTLSGAIMTFLDTYWNEGLGLRILGGSEDQSDKMYSYYKSIVYLDRFKEYIDAKPTKKRTILKNGSHVEILTQSQTSVRGTHVPILRMDEIDEFSQDIYETAIMIASKWKSHKARVEIFSTMHHPYGVMKHIVDRHEEDGRQLYKWCVFDIMEKCTEDRNCSRCLLTDDCRGKARKADGYFAIDDAIRYKRTLSDERWKSEMLCEEPTRSGRIWKDFSPSVHVVPYGSLEGKKYKRIIVGVDFGHNHPFVAIYIGIDNDGSAYIFREIYEKGWKVTTMTKKLKELHHETEGHISNYYCDSQAPEKIAEFQGVGLPAVKANKDVAYGIDAVTKLLERGASGKPRLFVSDKCPHTITEMQGYRYMQNSDKPIKKADDCCDGLRYAIATEPMLATRDPAVSHSSQTETLNRITKRIDTEIPGITFADGSIVSPGDYESVKDDWVFGESF